MLMNKALHIAELIANDNYIHACIDITIEVVNVHQDVFSVAVARGVPVRMVSSYSVIVWIPKLTVVGQNHRIWRAVNNHTFQAAIGDAFNHGSEFSYLS